MTEFRSHSQVCQDRFAWNILKHTTTGFFLDIGCGHPISCNNSYALEEVGWCGIMNDLTPLLPDPPRRALFIPGDASRISWTQFLPHQVHYLSLDADEKSGDVLRHLLVTSEARFSVITIEHDLYLRGPELCKLERQLLTGAGYELVCANVLWEGHPFEDWWIDPQVISQEISSRFKCIGVEGSIAAK
jgi:hypothetical protein